MRAATFAALLSIGAGLPIAPVTVSSAIRIDAESAADAAALAPALRDGQARVEAFFGSPFTKTVVVDIAPDRRGFDARLAARWKMPPTECWMVAAADATGMPVLAPARWKAEACEHDGADAAHVASVLAHELVHAFHGQHNPRPDLSLPDEVGWFAEGLAVYASGQLEDGHLAEPREAIARGLAPARLAEAWSGKYRYGVSGTLVREADRRAGRDALVRALGATSSSEALAALGTTEAQLLASWRESLTR
jgi:hypothetical protein